LWDKEKFAEEMGFKEQQLSAKQSSQSQSSSNVPTWLQRYIPYLKMQPDKLDAMVNQGYIVDVNGEQRQLTEDDKIKLSALAQFLHALEPSSKKDFLSAFNGLIRTYDSDGTKEVFGEDGAIQILNMVNTDVPEAKVLKQIVADYGSLQDFASVYEQANTYGLKDSVSKYIQTLEESLGVDKDTITSVFSYVLNLYKSGYGR
jgi:hypothetical protein